MTRKEALAELIAKAEAGELPQPRDFRAALEVPMQDMRYTQMPNDARAAYGGSLDAAKALHEAVLPGWRWDVTVHAASVQDSKAKPNPRFPSSWGLFDGCITDNPARAWLLAILRALHSMEAT